jgi:hypothetical protein
MYMAKTVKSVLFYKIMRKTKKNEVFEKLIRIKNCFDREWNVKNLPHQI